MSTKEHIGVVGAGTMGAGIAQTAAQYGHSVVLYDSSEEARLALLPKLRKTFDRLIEKKKFSAEQADEILSRITPTASFEEFGGCALIIEAVHENLATKKEVFSALELHTNSDCILASNTSSLALTAIASACRKSERVVGTHFFNPAPVMKLVELVEALQTSTEVLTRSEQIISGWNKTLVRVKDTPGFIVNRIARPFYGEALKMLEEQYADVPTIDWAMRTRGGFRMGPFELMDLIGIDINYTVSESIFQIMYFDPRYRPSIQQKRYVEAGRLGRKTGRGFYSYAEGSLTSEPTKDEKLGDKILHRTLVLLINEAVDALFRGVASPADIELAMTHGVNYPKGLLAWADELGLDFVLNELEKLQAAFGEDRYRPSPLLRTMVQEKRHFIK